MDSTEYTQCFGVTSVENPLLITDDTLFQIGSTTKTSTATAIMRLDEQGEIEIDATVRSYIPDFALTDQDVAERITVRHLLNHMAGWFGDFFDNTGDGDYALAKYVAKMVELPQLTPVRDLRRYSSKGRYSSSDHGQRPTGTRIR